MAQLIVRNLETEIKILLKERAAKHGWSMEEEVRQILRKVSGRPVDMRDTFIAGIALARRATLATRNTEHFDDLSIPVVDPWRGARGDDARA